MKTRNYVVRFNGQKKVNYLLLVKDICEATTMPDIDVYLFADLEDGTLYYNDGPILVTPDEAEEYLATEAEILQKNEICTTYIP